MTPPPIGIAMFLEELYGSANADPQPGGGVPPPAIGLPPFVDREQRQAVHLLHYRPRHAEWRGNQVVGCPDH